MYIHELNLSSIWFRMIVIQCPLHPEPCWFLSVLMPFHWLFQCSDSERASDQTESQMVPERFANGFANSLKGSDSETWLKCVILNTYAIIAEIFSGQSAGTTGITRSLNNSQDQERALWKSTQTAKHCSSKHLQILQLQTETSNDQKHPEQCDFSYRSTIRMWWRWDTGRSLTWLNMEETDSSLKWWRWAGIPNKMTKPVKKVLNTYCMCDGWKRPALRFLLGLQIIEFNYSLF